MTRRYKGATLSANAATTTGGESGVAAGSWTLAQQAQAQSSGTWPMQPLPKYYIEEVFSTYLYTGAGAGTTINNGIDLAGKGGLFWLKARAVARDNILTDTARGPDLQIMSNTTYAGGNYGAGLQFNSNGVSFSGADADLNGVGTSYASWTFRKQPKFFDVVTYTGDGVAGRTVAHNLGSVPGFFMIKRTDSTGDWRAYHQTLGADKFIFVNVNDPAYTSTDIWNNTAPTSTVFTLGNQNSQNVNGATYVAYLFAHNAGGFGLTGTDNVISCGSFTSSIGGTNIINLGWEPQFVMVKSVSAGGDWYIVDSMRGNPTINGTNLTERFLRANLSSVEAGTYGVANPTATGFISSDWGSATTFIYIAIRRGPMKVPTDGTKVFLPTTFVGSNTVNKVVSTNFTVDMTWGRTRDAANGMEDYDRLRGNTVRLSTDLFDPETGATALYFDVSNGVSLRAGYDLNFSTYNFINYNFARAPGFFDEVCYTGTGVATTVAHNLGVVPELMIAKSRSALTKWVVYVAPLGGTKALYLNETGGQDVTGRWNSTNPTTSVFSVGTTLTNESGQTYVWYGFATCPGVSKVGSYTGTGATQTIACGFAAGARFVLIKRTDSTGDWYVWDSARGMVSGTDPSLMLNSTAAEVNANSIYAATTGFQIVSTAAGINASGGTYIFLAIA